MRPDRADRSGRLRKAVVNVVGFAVGLALFGWIVSIAVQGEGWDRLLDTSPLMVAALLGCTAVSAVCNGATFWVLALPIRRFGFLDLQLLNLVANALNYAPLRLGAIARAAYHLRVDRLTVLQLAVWFSIVGYVVMLAIGSCLMATLLRSELDAVWIALVIGQMILGAAAVRVVFGFSLVRGALRGVDGTIVGGPSLWSAVVLRLLDLAAYTGRFAVAMMILDVHLPTATDVVVLSVIALAASLIPFGRLGFREACVALTAARLDLGSGQVESTWAQLALVESAGEALVYIPAGGLALLWYRRKWRSAAPMTGAGPSPSPGDEV
ncbi:MAG: hypothetical protein ACYTJ0_16925 [Planctomycetota bacterium]|jgi:hypothetical protein